MIIVSLIGLKKSGKTTCVEALVREFKGRGMKVGAVKSMVHSRFTVDTEGKDTWRHQRAGADFVISLSKDEMAYIERRPARSRLDEFLRFVPSDTDVLVCEGLEDPDPRIVRVLVAESPEQIPEILEVRGSQGNVIAVTGIIANAKPRGLGHPVLDCTRPEQVAQLADLIMEKSI